MRVGVYGLPRSGKDYFIDAVEKLGLFTHIQGSVFLDSASNGKFRSLPDPEKNNLRLKFIDHLHSHETDIIADGHYAFPCGEEYSTVFTNSDGDCYDTIIYLDTPSDVILERMAHSDKNSTYADFSVERIEEWKKIEINGLRRECFSRRKELIIFDGDMDSQLHFMKLISMRSPYADSAGVAMKIAKEIEQIAGRRKRIFLLDCDRTLSTNDPTRDFLSEAGINMNQINSIYNGGRYSSYQFWKSFNVYLHVADFDKCCHKAVDKAIANRFLIEDLYQIKNTLFVGLTSGITHVWNGIRDKYCSPDIIIGSDSTPGKEKVVSDSTKGFIAIFLREMGYEVFAAGDSMVDIHMLTCADRGYAISTDQLSRSLCAYLETNQTGIKQPEYNSHAFREIKKVRSIHEDIE